ncbi:hypothetical protein BGZ46_003206, partial [Entomortierella lignicola]
TYRHAIRAFSGPDPRPVVPEEEISQASAAIKIIPIMISIESRVQENDPNGPNNSDSDTQRRFSHILESDLKDSYIS